MYLLSVRTQISEHKALNCPILLLFGHHQALSVTTHIQKSTEVAAYRSQLIYWNE